MEKAMSLIENQALITTGLKWTQRGFLAAGKGLWNIREGNQYLPDYNNITEYADKEHGLGHSTANGLIRVYEVYGHLIEAKSDYQQINYTRLIEAVPHTTEDNIEYVLESAAHIPDAKSYANFIRQLKGKVCTDDPHECEFVTLQICKICNKKIIEKSN